MQAAMGDTASGERKASSLVPLDTLGGLAKASIAAGDKSLDKAEQHYKSAGLYLAEAKERVARTKNLTWPAYLNKHCPIGRRQADLYIEVANGTKTMAEVNERARTSMAASRAKQSAQRCAQPAENHQQKQQQQEENIAAANNQESAPRKYVNITPDPRLKIIGKITLKTRDANLPELKIVDDFFAKLLSKRRAAALN
jgi:hypothetical protein